MTILVEIKKSLTIKTQTMEKGVNTVPNEILSTNISSEVSKDKVSKIKMQDTRIPYHHPNYKSHCINRQPNQR
jgi:hypothetical protein